MVSRGYLFYCSAHQVVPVRKIVLLLYVGMMEQQNIYGRWQRPQNTVGRGHIVDKMYM